MRALVVQNTQIEGPGHLGKLLSDDFDVAIMHARHEELPRDGFDLAVILGGPQSANDDLSYLRAQESLIRRCVSKQVPVLGVCLGSQLIARALGGMVHPGPEKEVGFYSDLAVEDGSGLLAGFDDPFTAFHWHGDTFELPPGAVRLASSALYKNQAFRSGCAVGLQFHLEVDSRMVGLWLDCSGVWDADSIRSCMPERIRTVRSNMEIFYRNYKSEFF